MKTTNPDPQQPRKITLTTIKQFIAKNRANLLISTRSRFDGISQCANQAFRAAVAPDRSGKPFVNLGRDNTLGIQGAWFVFESRDYFRAFDENGLIGYRVSNCCGDFILAVRQEQRVSKVAA